MSKAACNCFDCQCTINRSASKTFKMRHVLDHTGIALIFTILCQNESKYAFLKVLGYWGKDAKTSAELLDCSSSLEPAMPLLLLCP